MVGVEAALSACPWKHEHFAVVGLVAQAEHPEEQQSAVAAEADGIPEGFEGTE